MRRARLDTLLPTQLYISELKHQYWSERLSANGVDDYEPVPVKRIGNDLFMTDGHTRAVVLWQLGVREIEAYNDADELDWFAYLEDLKWCRDARVLTVAELAERIIPHDDYEVKWRGRCETAHKTRRENPLGGVSIQLEVDRSAKAAIAREVLENLPQWFGIPEAVEEYVTASVDLPFVRVDLYEKPIGFCSVKVNYQINADLFVLGILPEFHGRGIGKLMMSYIVDYCRSRRIPYMTVKTLSERHLDSFYRRTRRFYISCGFRPFEEFPDLWGEANPCLYMIRAVARLDG